jgi:hypothetical protein
VTLAGAPAPAPVLIMGEKVVLAPKTTILPMISTGAVGGRPPYPASLTGVGS